MSRLTMMAGARLRMANEEAPETEGVALLSDEPTIELVLSARNGDRMALEALLSAWPLPLVSPSPPLTEAYPLLYLPRL